MAFPILGNPYPEFTDVNGNPYASGTLEFRKPADNSNAYSYPTADDADAQTNPNGADLTLNQRGTTSVGVWGEDGVTYKVTLKDSTGATVWTSTDIGWALTSDMVDDALSTAGVGLALYPRTAAETAAGIAAYVAGNAMGEIVNPQYPPGQVERYGTNTTPGTTDMYAAIQAAVDQLEQTGGSDVVFQSRQIYKIGTGITWYADNSTIHGNGARIQHSADICPLTIGELGADKSMARSRILGGLDFEFTGTAGDSTKPAVQIYQSIEGDYHFNSILNYYKGIYMTSDSSGCAYNKIHFDRIKNCELYGIHLYGNVGYVNENKFYCGRFTFVTSAGVPAGGRHIYIDREASSTQPPNHNTFYSPCCEMSAGSTMAGYIYDDGQFNTYFEPRLELGGTETISVSRVRFGEKSKWNCIYGGYNFDGGSVSDLGEKNRWFMRDQIKVDAGNPASAYSIFSGMRAQVNSDSKPACLIEDLYGTNTSGDAQVFKARARRNGTAGYYYDAERAGSLVIGLDDLFTYECILAHNGSATDRPGVSTPTANWATYWRKLNTKDGGAAWVATTAYTAAATQFRIASDGKIWTNQSAASVTSTVPTASGSVDRYITVYSEAGVALGELPLFDVGRFST